MTTPSKQQRTQLTREQIRAAAYRLFLRHGYLATSTDAIMAEAGIASKETLYRYYASKEELFVDVLGQLTLQQPQVVATLSQLPPPTDPRALRHALTTMARAFLVLMSQHEYQALLRVIITESVRFPQLSQVFRTTVPQRAITLVMDLLHQARGNNVIADVDADAVTHALLGGLLTYAVAGPLFAHAEAQPPALERADALVDVIMRAVTTASTASSDSIGA